MPERTSPSPAAVDHAEAEMTAPLARPAAAPDATASYGDHEDQVIDFYRPRGLGDGRPAPLVVVFHGGEWRQRVDRRHISPFAAFLAGHGFAVASVEYRRGAADDPVTPGRWPDTLDDTATAADMVTGLAVEALGAEALDPRRTILTGHSAGGHLALWAAARHVLPPDSPWHRPSPPPLRGVVALAPIADLAAARRLRLFSDGVTEFLGGPEHVEERRQQLDPALLLPTGIATTIVQGTTDIEVPPEVSEAFADEAAQAGEPVQLTLLDAVGHEPLIDPDSGAATVVAEEIAQLAW